MDVLVAREGGVVTVEVLDNGPGIPPDKLDFVFNRFFRTDDARTSEGEVSGTGLGLAIVKAIVSLHGGSVSAKNRPVGGTAIRVEFPGTPENFGKA